ncbi:reprolysin-like metallopeptidase [Aquibium sp. LZ166]|uniref:Reprolysin-like metallopeptidase n=1 Tax=Aquibium pacificus TaxID=3153579 RepID=A0ABV3SQU4_9HYPH
MEIDRSRGVAPAEFLAIILMSVCCILFFVDRSRAQENRLFSYAGGEAVPALTADQESRAAAISSDATQTDLKYVDAEPAALRGDTVAVPLAEGTLVLGLTHRIERAEDDFTWIGQGSGEGGQTVLVVRDGQITGVIYDGFVQYSLTPLGGRLHALTKIDPKAFPPDHPPGPLPVSPRDSRNRAGDLGGTAATVQIDILGAYTAEALAANANIKNTIQLGVDLANAAYIASNAEVSLRLVGTMQVAGYSEAGKTYHDLLYNLTDGAGGMASVHAQRETLGADLVALFVNHTEYCGLAWVNSSAAYAFSVTTHTCVNSHTFSHELGHNFGALHDVANSGSNPPYNYGYGYIHPQNLFRTIQSYGAPCGYCTRIGNFSNPDVTYNGHVTGTVTTHNVARVHRERKSTVAAFRADKTPAKAVLISPKPGPGTTLGSTATFVWTTGTGVTQYWLYVGSTGVGSYNIYQAGQGTSTSRTVSNLPASGTVYVRLWSMIAGAWQYNDYTYKAGSATKAVMSSPTPGSTLGSSATFQWTTGTGVTSFWLSVGSTGVGSWNILSASNGTSTTRAVTNLPATGTIYVRLYSLIAGAWQFNDYTYKAGGGTKAVMTAPVPGSTLGSAATFQWTTGSGVKLYWLFVGSTGVGSSNIYQANQGLGNSRTVTGLPSAGTIHVRLWSLIAGAWQYEDYSYQSGSPKAVMTSPTPGATLNSSETFEWTTGSGVIQYWLFVGSTGSGSSNIFQADQGTKTSGFVSALPSGGTIYVRLWSRFSAGWQYNDYVYKAGGGAKAVMKTPQAGSTIGSTATFTWSEGSGVTGYWLYVGSTGAGSLDIYQGSQDTNTSKTVTGLPTKGTIYVRLWSLLNARWQYNDYTYKTVEDYLAEITSPDTGSQLGTSATFAWSKGKDVSGYMLYVGTTGAGSYDIYRSPTQSVITSLTVHGLPSDNGQIYVRLWSRYDGFWYYRDYTYASGSPKAVMVFPVPGSKLGSTTTFQWTPGSAVTAYWLYVGSKGFGSYDLYEASQGKNTSRTVSGIPLTSEPDIYVRLWSLIGGSWQYVDYRYLRVPTGTIVSPRPGSTLGSSATFEWAPEGHPFYSLSVGSAGQGSSDVYDGGYLQKTSQTVTGLPSVGPIFVTLYSIDTWGFAFPEYNVYEGEGGNRAELTTPMPGSGVGSSATFKWTAGTGATEYELQVGSTGKGSSNIYSGNQGTGTSQTVSNLPDGGTVYVRLRSLIDGNWAHLDYTYTAFGTSQPQSPLLR